MNQKEWSKFSKLPSSERQSDLFKFRNMAEKLLGYKRRCGLVIHHLRDTEEQRRFNDLYYERWGIDFDGQIKYCVLMSKEEHSKLHSLSDETKRKISESVSISKTRLTDEERLNNKILSDKRYAQLNKEKIKAKNKAWYEKNKEKIKEYGKKYRQEHSDDIKLRKKEWKLKNRDHVNRKKREYYRKKKHGEDLS